jgi:hypothetical protein
MRSPSDLGLAKYRVHEWHHVWPGRFVSPLFLAVFGYVFTSLRNGHVGWSPQFAIACVVIAVVVSELLRPLPRYAAFHDAALQVHRLRGRYVPKDKWIIYNDIGGVTRDGDVVDVAYVGPSFLRRRSVILHERFRPDLADEFEEELRRRATRTGWNLQQARHDASFLARLQSWL